jgi:hypothetical protein
VNTFEDWLATSPNATWLKVALGAALGAAASWIATSDLHPLVITVFAAVTPVILNWLNVADPRYGIGSGVLAGVHDIFADEDDDA